MTRSLHLLIALLAVTWLSAGCTSGSLIIDDTAADDDDTADDDDDATGDDDDDATGDDDDDDTADDDDDDTPTEWEGDLYVIIYSWWDIEGFGWMGAVDDGGALTGEGELEVDLGDEVIVAVATLDGTLDDGVVGGQVIVLLSELSGWLPDLAMELEGDLADDGTLAGRLTADLGWLGTAEGSVELWP